MDLVIIGSGNVAAVLGRKFMSVGHSVLQIVSRNAATASELAYEWDTFSTNYYSAINTRAEVYIIAIPDEAISEVAKELNLPGKVVAHTAASVPMEILSGVSRHHGVLYPLQSLRKEMKMPEEIPVYYEGSDELARKKLSQLAYSIGGPNVKEANGDQRLKLHVAAVVVSNFPNHLYALAQEYCESEGLDFNQLLPLIEETVERIRSNSAANLQTGPAARHDLETIRKHLKQLENHPQLQKLYSTLTESIQQLSLR